LTETLVAPVEVPWTVTVPQIISPSLGVVMVTLSGWARTGLKLIDINTDIVVINDLVYMRFLLQGRKLLINHSIICGAIFAILLHMLYVAVHN
jgi:hypothetical protein